MRGEAEEENLQADCPLSLEPAVGALSHHPELKPRVRILTK